jgi:hypothetical protein
MSMEINVFCLAGDGKNIDAIARYRFEFVQNSQRLPRKWNDVVMLHLHVFIGNISFGRVEIDFDFASRGRAVSIDSAQDCTGILSYSCDSLSQLYRKLHSQAGLNGSNALAGRRTFAVRLHRKGFDLKLI